MTKHLSDVELVDYLDDMLPAARAAHLHVCGVCRGKAESLRHDVDGMLQAQLHQVPEPSPLFWEHFSRRVRDAVHEFQPATPSPRRFAMPFIGWASVTALVILATAAILWNTAPRSHRGLSVSPAAVHDRAAPMPPEADLNLDDDEEWALVRLVAEDLQWEEAQDAGLNPRPGSMERVALEMSPTDRQELARLIEDELKGTGA